MGFKELVKKVKLLPYGRNSNRFDFSLVLSEKKGTCSSKHAYLKDYALKNNIEGVKLFIGIYKMNAKNTNIGSILRDNNLDYIPEAHCYLSVENQYIDVTHKNSSIENLRADILEEIEIEPFQVIEFKIKYHQEFIKKWIHANAINFTFEQLWSIREQCIGKLANQNEEVKQD